MKVKSDEPRWIIAKFGYCSNCQNSLKEKKALYYPSTHDILCEDCSSFYYKIEKDDEEEIMEDGEYAE